MSKFSVNEVRVLGNLGQDPEISYTKGGKCVANISVATTKTWPGPDQKMQERTEWHRLVAFGRHAEIVRDCLKKGNQAYFEGYLQTEKWQDNNQQDRYTTEIVVERVGLLGSKPAQSGSPAQAGNSNNQQQNAQ